jgi:hypothetical protein
MVRLGVKTLPAHQLAGAHNMLLLIRRSVRLAAAAPREGVRPGAPGAGRVSLNGLFEHPAEQLRIMGIVRYDGIKAAFTTGRLVDMNNPR